MTYKEKIVDAETGEETWRDYTDEEIAEVEKNIAIAEKEKQELAAKAAQKQQVLEMLGITEEQAKLILS